MSDAPVKTPKRLIARVSVVVAINDGDPNLPAMMDDKYHPLDVTADSLENLRIAVMNSVDAALAFIGVPRPDEIGNASYAGSVSRIET